MPVTLQEVREILQRKFEGMDVSSLSERDFEITGPVTWDGFEGKSLRVRHNQIMKKLRDPLGLRGLNVGVIYPLAPGEDVRGGAQDASRQALP